MTLIDDCDYLMAVIDDFVIGAIGIVVGVVHDCD